MTGETEELSAASLNVYRSTDALAETPWNDIIGATPTAQYGSLRTFESASTIGATPHYFVLGSTQRPLAVAVGHLATTVQQCERVTRPLLGRAGALAPALMEILGPTLILGLRPMYGPSLFTDARLRPEAQQENLIHLCREIERFADDEGLTLAVAGLTDRDRAAVDVLRDREFGETLGFPTAELEIQWDSWQGYLEHLKSSRKKVVRREVRAFADAGCRIRILQPGEPTPPTASGLLQQHQIRRNKRTHPYKQTLVADLLKNLGNNVRIYLAEHQNELLGIGAFVLKGTVAAASFLGIGSQFKDKNMFVYFNLGFYELIRDAPEVGLRRILYGTQAYDGKRLRGCSIIPTRLFIRPASTMRRRIFGSVLGIHQRWYERKFSRMYT